jgi:broad specificity phosphatase PhoE
VRTLLAARHGESEYSLAKLVNGDPGVACALTEAGRAQARALGRALVDDRIDLCAVTEFERVRETAELALEGRDVPFLVVPELNEPRYGDFEGGPLDSYREWVWGKGPLDAPAGGEHRGEIAARYARGLRTLLARPEETILLVAHSLPLAYLHNAAEGRPPVSRSDQVAYAEPVGLGRASVERAADVLEKWAGAPIFEAH